MELDLSFSREGSNKTLSIRTKVIRKEHLIDCSDSGGGGKVDGFICSDKQLTEFLNIPDPDDDDTRLRVFMLLPDQTIKSFVPGLFCSSKPTIDCVCSWPSVETTKWQKQ